MPLKSTELRRRLTLVLITVLWGSKMTWAGLPDIVERVTPSVVGVGTAFPQRAPTGGKATARLLGTGFAVDYGSHHVIVTNAHVVPTELDVAGGERIAVFVGRGATAQQRFATLLRSDEKHDLALLSYAGAPLPSLLLADNTSARAGERVAFTGFPIGGALGLYAATQEGIVSAITPVARAADRGRELSAVQLARLRNPYDVYQLDAIAYPGNSGSAVYRVENGEVIGVMNSVFIKESRENLLSNPSGIAYAIPVRHLKALLSALSDR